MANKLYEETDIQAIAEAIREKTGTDTKYDVSEMAAGVNEVYEAGQSVAENSIPWDIVQDYGNRTHYTYAFYGWGSEYIRPKYKISFIRPANSTTICMFMDCKKLKIVEKEYFDFSQYTPSAAAGTQGHYATFRNCQSLEYVEDLGMQAGGYYQTWAGCSLLHTVEIMRCAEDTVYNDPFAQDRALVNLTIEGIIGTSFPVKQSPLSAESQKSIIKHLKNYAGTSKEYSYTLTLKATAFTTLENSGFTEDDISWLTENGMTYTEDLTWADVIDNLKWNLVKQS